MSGKFRGNGIVDAARKKRVYGEALLSRVAAPTLKEFDQEPHL